MMQRYWFKTPTALKHHLFRVDDKTPGDYWIRSTCGNHSTLRLLLETEGVPQYPENVIDLDDRCKTCMREMEKIGMMLRTSR